MENKDTSIIPSGHYCYVLDMEKMKTRKSRDGYPTIKCPYLQVIEDCGVKIPYCKFMELGGIHNNITDEEFEKLVDMVQMKLSGMNILLTFFGTRLRCVQKIMNNI